MVGIDPGFLKCKAIVITRYGARSKLERRW
jgi:hypothetical protein